MIAKRKGKRTEMASPNDRLAFERPIDELEQQLGQLEANSDITPAVAGPVVR